MDNIGIIIEKGNEKQFKFAVGILELLSGKRRSPHLNSSFSYIYSSIHETKIHGNTDQFKSITFYLFKDIPLLIDGYIQRETKQKTEKQTIA